MMRGSFGASYLPPTNLLHKFKDDWTKGTWAEPWAEDMLNKRLTIGLFLIALEVLPMGPAAAGAGGHLWAEDEVWQFLSSTASQRDRVCGYDGSPLLCHVLGRAGLPGWIDAGLWHEWEQAEVLSKGVGDKRPGCLCHRPCQEFEDAITCTYYEIGSYIFSYFPNLLRRPSHMNWVNCQRLDGPDLWWKGKLA